MRLLVIILSLASCAIAKPGFLLNQGSRSYGEFSSLGTSLGRNGYRSGLIACGPGQADDGTGACVDAAISQSVFVFSGPDPPVTYGPPPQIPRPKIDYNVVFVRTPEQPEPLEPIVVPPPQQRTIVYVLTKNGQAEQKVIEVPAAPGQAPEVFYVNYDDGDNPTLAGGHTLQDVLSLQGQRGQVVSSGAGAGYAFGGGPRSGFRGGAGFGFAPNFRGLYSAPSSVYPSY